MAIMSDIATRMLFALTENVEPAALPVIPLEEQKRLLKRHVDSLSIEDKKAIGSILVMNGKQSALIWCTEGTVINMDTLPDGIVSQMYNLLIYKMNKISQ